VARPKRVPFKPDGFQRHAGSVASWLNTRGFLVAVGAVAVVGAFVAAVVLANMHESSENASWRAYETAAGDIDKLENALAVHESGSARPFMLLALGGLSASPPADKDGKPLAETAEAREERLARAEKVLRELVNGYPGFAHRPPALVLLGLVIEEQSRHAPDRRMDAVAVFEEALDAEPGAALEAFIQYHIGRNCWLAGKNDRARMALTRAGQADGIVRLPYWGPIVAPWRENVDYLLALIGPGDRAIPMPETDARPPQPPPAGGGDPLD